jgi:hypothetical protein
VILEEEFSEREAEGDLLSLQVTGLVGDANPQFSHDVLWANGDGVQKDRSQPTHECKMTGDQRHLNGQFNYFLLIENGNGIVRAI